MPEETYWNSLFDGRANVKWLDLTCMVTLFVEIGREYGRFAVPVASAIRGSMVTIDIDPVTVKNKGKRPKGCIPIVFG